MLESILGSLNRERVMIYLVARDDGYAREIARFFKVGLDPIQKQLEKLAELAEAFAKGCGDTQRDEIELDFHGAILEATGSKMLTRMFHVISAYFSKSANEVNGWDINEMDEKSCWEHKAIAEALSQRNVERARVILMGHLS